MKVVRLVLIMVVVLSAAMSVNAQKKNEKTVIFNANLHCESCKAKVEKNIPYEKGVKDLKVDSHFPRRQKYHRKLAESHREIEHRSERNRRK